MKDYISTVFSTWSDVCTAAVRYAEEKDYKVISVVRSNSQERCVADGGVTICNMITQNGNEICIAIAVYGT